ncbi:MAG: hypothetical protein H7345_11030 [Rubritepida sp.]|nr:hypothetical protein [Rubritepida sp.]
MAQASIEEVARTLSARDPRDLLRGALPGCEPRLYRLLDRATCPVWTLEEYRTLDDLVRLGEPRVTEGREMLSPADLADLRDGLSDDPLTRRLVAPYHREDREAVRTVLLYLRHAGLFGLVEEVPRGSGTAAVGRRVLRALAAAEAPAVPFPTPAGWVRLRSAGEVFAIGARLRNCLRRGEVEGLWTLVEFLAGRTVLLFHQEAEVLAEFVAMPAGLWQLRQANGAANATVPEPVVRALQAALHAAGVVLLPQSLSGAIS